MRDRITLLRAGFNKSLAKIWTPDGQIVPAANATWFQAREISVASVENICCVLDVIEKRPRVALVKEAIAAGEKPDQEVTLTGSTKFEGINKLSIDAEVDKPEPIPELRNFAVWTPDGVRDITSAFRMYHSAMERFERMAVGVPNTFVTWCLDRNASCLAGSKPPSRWYTVCTAP